MMTSNADEEKHDASVDKKLPAGWQCTTYRTTGYGKLVATMLAEGLEVETICDAEKVALTAMEADQ